MAKVWVNCVVLLVLLSDAFALPQGQRSVHQVEEHHNLDPVEIDEGMNQEHAKLVENLQRLKRTLDQVKERVGKGTYGESQAVDMKNPEGAILTVLKSLQEQGQLFSMINDMLKAGSEVQNQTARIQEYSDLSQQAHAEADLIERTNQIAPTSSASPLSPSPIPVVSSVPAIHSTNNAVPIATARREKVSGAGATKQQGYDDYHYQYRDDSKDATGDEHYDYHYDASGYDDTPKTTTTTTTTRRPTARRVRTRGRNEYY